MLWGVGEGVVEAVLVLLALLGVLEDEEVLRAGVLGEEVVDMLGKGNGHGRDVIYK